MVCHLSPCYITFNVSYQWLEGYGFNSRLDVRNFWVSQFEELRHSHSECPNKCWPNAEADVETVKQAKNWSVKNDVVFCHFWHKVPGCEKALATSNIAGRESSRKSLCPFIDLFLSPFSPGFFFCLFFFFRFGVRLSVYSATSKLFDSLEGRKCSKVISCRRTSEQKAFAWNVNTLFSRFCGILSFNSSCSECWLNCYLF